MGEEVVKAEHNVLTEHAPIKDAQGQLTTGSELAERHRTSKHRAPGKSSKASPKKTTKAKSKDGQKTLPFGHVIAAKISPNIVANNLLSRLWTVGLVAIAFGIFIFAYYWFSSSKLFELGPIKVEGNKLLTDEQIGNLVRPLVMRGVLRVDLSEIREKLRKNELVKQVEVTRLLPNMLKIRIQERIPFALTRRIKDNTIACVDEEGILFGNEKHFPKGLELPIINGLNEDRDAESLKTNIRHISTFRKLIADLDSSVPRLSDKIDEVRFDESQEVRIILRESNIAVFLGKEDFRAHLNAALDVIDAVRNQNLEQLQYLRVNDAEKLMKGDAKIVYINTSTYNSSTKRIIVGMDQ